MRPTEKITFEYNIPGSIVLSMSLVRRTLREVQEQLLSHDINGGDKKLNMDAVTHVKTCGMAACIGGWTGLFLLGFDDSRDNRLEHAADALFEALIKLDEAVNGFGLLHELFYDYGYTANYDEPNVAATAIGRYLRGVKPWPAGDMPNVLPYTKRAPAKKAKRK